MNNELLTDNTNDIKAVIDFCEANGIIGFQMGNLNPKIALKMLKKQVKESNSQAVEGKRSNKILLLG